MVPVGRVELPDEAVLKRWPLPFGYTGELVHDRRFELRLDGF
jgi:hypothetical protein